MSDDLFLIITIISMKRIYISAAGQISMQHPLCEDWISSPELFTDSYRTAADPDFKEYMTAAEARRLSKSLKRSLAVSVYTLRRGGIACPDAVVTGTGLGCVESTEAFLRDLCEHGEQLLKPTHFMQSTHNTYAALIAIATGAHGYNNTYSHKQISFESALWDAVLQLRAGKIAHALVGAHEGITPSYFTLLRRMGYVGCCGMVPCAPVNVALLLRTAEDSGARGDASPAAASLCELAGMKILYRPTDEVWHGTVDRLLADAGLTPETLDAVMTGVNGNPLNDEWYEGRFSDKPRLCYKPLFGESYTAAGAGLYAAAHILHLQVVPAVMVQGNAFPPASGLKNILLVHAYEGGRYISLLLLKASCGK